MSRIFARMRTALKTVRVRTTVMAVVVVGACLIVSSVATIYAQRQALTHNIQESGVLRAKEVASAVADNRLQESLNAQVGEGFIVQVVDPSHNVVGSTPNIAGRGAISNLNPGNGRTSAQTPERSPFGEDIDYQITATRVDTNGTYYIVYVASSLEEVTEGTVVLSGVFGVTTPLLMAIVGVLTWVLIGRSLRPVDQIRRQVAEIGSNDLSQRVPEPGTGDEIALLAHTMNEMLERLQVSADRQQRFVSDASHELRSPLTSIRTRLEVDLAYPEKSDMTATHREVLIDAIEMQSLVSDLLLLARSDGSSRASANEIVDLNELVEEEVFRVCRQTTHEVTITKSPDVQVRGHKADLRRAIRNLLNNAARHAESVISVSVERQGDNAIVVVGDDGAGIPAGEESRIFDRFTRLDEARSRDAGGTGLGLAITKELVESHGGNVSVSTGRGARFTIALPTMRS